MAVDLTGKRFGKLTVIGRDTNNKHNGKWWMCICDCQKGKRVPMQIPRREDKLLRGNTTSCGCAKNEQKTRGKHYTNKFDLFSEDYGIGYTSNGKVFYFDKEDFDLIVSTSKCWNFNDDNYLFAVDKRENADRYENGRRKLIKLKDLVMNKKHGEIVKYVDCTKTYDNRKCNLIKIENKKK